MLIGCFTWGSLVWNPIDLPVRGDWHKDGPFLPIEFARISQHDRFTLVVIYDKPDYPACRSLWTQLDVKTPEEAAEALRVREDCKPKWHWPLEEWKAGAERRDRRPVTDQEIAVTAYYIWKKNGSRHGRDVADWFAGKSQLEEGLA